MTEVCISSTGLLTGLGPDSSAFWQGLLTGRAASVGHRRETPRAQSEMSGVLVNAPRSRDSMVGAAVSESLAGADMAAFPEAGWVIRVGQLSHRIPSAPGASGPPARCHPLIPASVRSVLLSHACASGIFAVAFARDVLESGLAPAALVVGGFSLNHDEYTGMAVSRALSPTLSARPFSASRDGTVLGEGAGAVLLETTHHASLRGHTPLARIAGAATRVEPHTTASDTESIVGCLRDAVLDAGGRPIGAVHAHATGTVQGDLAELSALDRTADAFGWERPPVSAHKGMVGHLMHASALPGIVSAVMAIRSGTVAGTPGLRHPMTASSVRLPSGREPVPADAAHLVTAFGFGGNHGALVLDSP